MKISADTKQSPSNLIISNPYPPHHHLGKFVRKPHSIGGLDDPQGDDDRLLIVSLFLRTQMLY
jgi:hypothetical protein